MTHQWLKHQAATGRLVEQDKRRPFYLPTLAEVYLAEGCMAVSFVEL